MTSPEVSVLIPAFNAEETISASIWSVLNQSFQNLELLVYLDGCTDQTENIVRTFDDKRIQIFSADMNNGIVFSRNFLIQKAKGKYIAWQDADDISLAGRLAAQYEFMEVHPHLTILGTWVQVRNSRKVKTVKWPTDPAILDAWLFFRNPLVQSSTMVRNYPDKPVYNAEFEYLEDYKFYSEYLGEGRIGIYPEVLCSYLEDDENSRISKYLKYDFVGKLENIMRGNFEKLDWLPGKNELSLMRDFLRNSAVLKPAELKLIWKFLLISLRHNKKINAFDRNAFEAVIYIHIFRLIRKNPALIPWGIAFVFKHPLGFFYARKARVLYKN
ncbi:MAG: glycosyltransferase family 2 protein [Bacteroidetes bacterium]|nr:glycosyltransferase family 2 protein [Bacteroidota bacterium]